MHDVIAKEENDIDQSLKIDTQLLNWLNEFQKKHQRPLRVLHLGNVANNAYLNAKFLRSIGVEADVLCYDYYHALATPEWEETDFARPVSDYHPKFTKKMCGNYKRPNWFIQGPFLFCYFYLKAKRKNHRMRTLFFRYLLQRLNKNEKLVRVYFPAIYKGIFLIKIFLINRFKYFKKIMKVFYLTAFNILFYAKKNIWKVIKKVRKDKKQDHKQPNFLTDEISPSASSMCSRENGAASDEKTMPSTSETSSSLSWEPALKNSFFKSFIKTNMEMFTELFPNRSDQLQPEDLYPYTTHLSYWAEIFENYDIIEAYGTSPILPLLASNKPYIAYEHGTLRTFTMENLALHRLTAFAYRKANWAFVTNGDCLDYAKKLNMTRFSPMPHPIDINQHRTQNLSELKKIKEKFQADILLFCPLRHDWAIKGTDVHIKALPLIKAHYTNKRITVIFTEWGADQEKSRGLIRQLGCESMVVWLTTLPRIKMIQYMQAADVILDQMALPHFGSTAIQALAVGTPVIMSYKPQSTQWIAKEPAPIMPAFTPEQILLAINKATDAEWKKSYSKEATYWIEKYHSVNRIRNEHLRIFKDLVG